MKVIHISIRTALELVALVHENDLEDKTVLELIKEVEDATGARYDRLGRRWIEPR